MPDRCPLKKGQLLAIFGAQLVLTPGTEGMTGAIKKAEEIIAQNPDLFVPGESEDPANPEVHRIATAEEIWRDTEGKVDILIAGVGQVELLSELRRC